MPEGEKKRKRNYSPETLEKLSRLAKERHAQGKMGGAKFGKMGGRPRKERATRAVADAAQELPNRRAIIQVFKDAVDPDMPIGVRLKGAQAWLEMEQAESKIALQEEVQDTRQLGREQLLEILTEKLTSGPAADLLRRNLPQIDIPDVDVVEEDDEHAAA